jgi:hypothetical protein
VSTDENFFKKILEILDYLMVEFPRGSIQHKFVGSRATDIIFLFHDNQQIQITISSEFLKKNEPEDIEAKLLDFRLAESIREKKPPHIMLTDYGLKIDNHHNIVVENIDYRGYKIRATPYQLAKSKRWVLEFQIFSSNGNNILAKMFSAVNTFETGKEAALHCLNFGKQIIDSKTTQ